MRVRPVRAEFKPAGPSPEACFAAIIIIIILLWKQANHYYNIIYYLSWVDLT